MIPDQGTSIAIRGARVHNLKNVDCDLPRGSLVVITGPSGSGKSSLAFDTLYAEGRRRYAFGLSVYARQFLETVGKPEVDSITGLSPAIAIEQGTAVGHPRSTVATATEIYDHLRVLFAALGKPHCPRCAEAVSAQSPEKIAEQVMENPEGTAVTVLAPVVRGRKGAFRKELAELVAQGFRRARIDGRGESLVPAPRLDPRRNHRIEVLVERLVIRPGIEKRLLSVLEKALDLGQDVALVAAEGRGERLFSRRLACAACGLSVPEITPRTFSFNSPYGACPACQGLGVDWDVDPARVVPDESKSLLEGAVHPWQRHGPRLVRDALEELAQTHGFGLDVAFGELPREARRIILQGDGQGFPGVLNHLRRRVEALLKPLPMAEDAAVIEERRDEGEAFEDLKAYLSVSRCRECGGARLKRESLAVRVDGLNIAELVRLPIADAIPQLERLSFPERERPVADRLLGEMLPRLRLLDSLGLGYLGLERATSTLSRGEAQRIRLAGQIGARMQGVLYVLDEPSVGLHPKDNQRLLAALFAIRDQGNTVVVVEHDEETIRAADFVVDLGEGAGRLGGRVLYQGPPASLDGSLTGRYLRREMVLPVPGCRRAAKGSLRLRGAAENNLKNLDVDFPLGVLVAVTGVSGAGKSTLVEETLYRVLARRLYGAAAEPGRHRTLEGAEAIDKVAAVDQSPIGRTPRSNPATYTGAFGLIRELFSLTPEARARGYRPGRFSFNVKGGRCESCQGDGVRTVVMHFLPDVLVACEACKGTRYNRETLEVLYRGKSIADVLDLTVAEAQPFLAAHPRLGRLLATLVEVGLSYLRLGQSASSLSGGESQRVKLARELARRETGRTLYILDEPTTGLHFHDVGKLLHVLHRLVEAGNTVIVIEHNMDVIKTADHVIDLGPEGGAAGGRIVAQGTPEAVARSKRSATARYLREALRQAEPKPAGAGRQAPSQRPGGGES